MLYWALCRCCQWSRLVVELAAQLLTSKAEIVIQQLARLKHGSKWLRRDGILRRLANVSSLPLKGGLSINW